MKKNYIIIILLILSQALKAQNVNITDANFKNALINTLCVDTNGDGTFNADADISNDNEIQESEAEAVLRLNLDSQSISDISGIEKFTNLELLKCSVNYLTSLDFSQNVLLKDLYCDDNRLTSLNVSKNTALELLNCFVNNLTVLDVSENSHLITLYCGFNQLRSLDVSNNSSLTSLFCYTNELTSLNLKNGNNSQLFTMFALDNSNLTCIAVDDVDFASNAIGWSKDVSAGYHVNCGVLSSDDFKNDIQIICYPNPVKDVLKIKTPNPIEINTIKIYNALGHLVLKEASHFKQLNVSKLSLGMYLVVIETDTNRFTKRIVKD